VKRNPGQTSPLVPDFAGAQSGLRSPRTSTETGLNAFGTARIGRVIVKENIMSNGNSPSLAELEQRIAIARDNIRQLIEQAAAFSGAEDEDRNADRIAQQQEELERLVKQRDALAKKK
jgi:hypothetical protein